MVEEDGIETRAHILNAEEVEHELVTSIENGLTSVSHKERLLACGPNKIPDQKSVTFWELLWAQVNSVVIYILLIGSAISFAFQHIIDGFVIFGVVVVNVSLGVYMERKAMNATDSLKNMMSAHAQVIRNGEKITVDAIDLVPGDVILIQPGDIAPADARVVKQSNLEMMEAALTGESHGCDKDTAPCKDKSVGLADRKCMVFSGTQVMKGTATCIVTATGPECEIGKISGLLANITPPTKTPLLKQLDKFGILLSAISIGLAFATFGIAMGRGYSVIDSITIAIGIAVAAIPEGLPTCVTVTFAIGVSIMAKNNAIVKSLPAVETLGSVSVICSDKTGTLTMNKMSVQTIACRYVTIDATQAMSEDAAAKALACILPGVLCNDSTISVGADRANSLESADTQHSATNEGTVSTINGGPHDLEMAALTEKQKADLAVDFKVEGDPTERCILDLAVTLLGAPQAAKRLLSANPRIAEIPFDSATKYMATIHDLTSDLAALAPGVAPESGAQVILVKGAPESTLEFCYPTTTASDDPDRIAWLAHAEALAEQGMRVLGLAYRVVGADYQLGTSLPAARADAPQEAFTLSCLVGIIDPPRPEAIFAVAAAQSAGITVKMITGDHPVTARAVGRVLGLKCSTDKALTGTDLDAVMIRSMAEFDSVVLHNDVFARTTPEHKLRIVESLRRQGFVCSMTGDGVNDAPALKAADIGVAMGITGTEVAKDAANMIITDDNFASIVEAIRIGRCTYANLIKIIAFMLPTNGGHTGGIIGALILDIAVPITALQILWVNMVTSVTLGIVLAFDKPDQSVLADTPRRPDKPIFGQLLSWRMFCVSVMLILIELGIFRWEMQRGHDADYLRTCSVNALVTAQVAYIFNCRSVRRPTGPLGMITGNVFVFVGIAAIMTCQVLFTYAPPFQYVFKTKPIDGVSWGKIILLAACVFIAVEADKHFNLARKRFHAWRKAVAARARLQQRTSFTRRPSSEPSSPVTPEQQQLQPGVATLSAPAATAPATSGSAADAGAPVKSATSTATTAPAAVMVPAAAL